MANEVFANTREISCKSGDGKVIASFPDVCFTPPQTPATPPGVPVPYPISSRSGDTTEGSKTVTINNNEVMLRNISCYKKCTGDEAGNAPKKGIITSSHRSRTFFASWSMDVKIEGENVVRDIDITTSNHASVNANSFVPMINQESMTLPSTSPHCNTADDRLTEEMDNPPDSLSRVREDRVTQGRGKVRIRDAYKGREPPAVTLGVGLIVGGPSAGTHIPGHSRTLKSKNTAHFAKGIKGKQKSRAAGCGSATGFQYDRKKFKHRHAEAKIIEDWFKAGAPGQLVLFVSRPVCESCAELIKHVNCNPNGENCKKVFVCDGYQDAAALQRLKC
jgi:Domain of unknown function (DUF4150)